MGGSGGGRPELASGQAKSLQDYEAAISDDQRIIGVKRIIGLDLGTRTCGIAISDTLGIAHGYENFRFLRWRL
jgi:hypothetical protein